MINDFYCCFLFALDTLKALLILAKNLPKDIRKKGDPKVKGPIAHLNDIVEVVQVYTMYFTEIFSHSSY